MNAKKIITGILILFVVASAGYFIYTEASGSNKDSYKPESNDKNQQSVSNGKDKIIVYYFFTTYRCTSCTLIEQYTREAVEQNFADEIEQGLVEFRSLNIEEPQNEHFIKDYELAFKTVVASKLSGGKEIQWKRLDKVWELLQEPLTLKAFIVKEISSYLGEG